MSRNGSGIYSLASGNPVVTGTVISSTDFNNTMSDLATAMTGSIAADGQTAWAGNQNANGNRITSLGSAAARTDAIQMAQVQDGSVVYLTGVAGTNTITASVSGLAAYAAGQEFRFIAAGANTGATTLNINSIGAKSITRNGTNALIAGDIPSGAAIEVFYDGTQFQLVSQPSTGRLLGYQTFTGAGTYTYTPTAGTAYVIVEVQAPGGGSGGAASVTAGQFAAAGAGGGGGYGVKKITSAFSGVTVTIGAAGLAGTSGNNPGGNGGTTSFGALLSCTGGVGGGGGAAINSPGVGPGGTGPGSAGGTATGADFSRTGGWAGISFAVSTAAAVRGDGGDSFYGSGGGQASVVSSVTGGANGVGFGGGASGPININATLSATGGNPGAPGIVIVWEYA